MVAFFLHLLSYMAYSSHSLFRTEKKATFSKMANKVKGILYRLLWKRGLNMLNK